MLLPTTDVAAATTHLRAAHTALDDATALLRRASRLDWDSAAAEACHAAVGGLGGLLDADAATLAQAIRVAAACETA